MKNIKELFQNFETNRWLYFDVARPPAIDIAGANLNVPTTQVIPPGPLNPGREFENKKQVAIGVLKNIHLDTDTGKQNEEEKHLALMLEAHITGEFRNLEHNYQEELKVVGRGPENQEAIKAREALNKAADNFIFKMEMHVLEHSIYYGNKQAELMAQIRLIDGFTKVPGFGQHFIEGNPDIVKSLIQSNPRNREEFNKLLTEMLDNEEYLERGVVAMIKKTPNFREMNSEGKVDEAADSVQQVKEEEVFTRLFARSFGREEQTGKDTESLTYYVGKGQWHILQQTFVRRFNIKFQDNNSSKLEDVDHYVDLMNNNKVIKPNEIESYLLRISKESNLRSPEKIEEYNEEIDKKEEAQADLYNELLRGFTWSSDNEVTGLDTLRNNSQLNKLIQTTARYENVANEETAEINKQLAKLNQDLGDAAKAPVVQGITNKLTPSFIKQTPALRRGGLAELLQLIWELAGNKKEDAEKNTTALAEVKKGLDRGENPSKEVTNSMRRYWENMPKASVTELFTAYANPTGAEAQNLFKKNDEKPPTTDKYPTIAVPRAIEAHLKEALGFTKFLNIKKTGEVFNLNFRKDDDVKMFTIKKDGENLVITDLDNKDKPQTIPIASTTADLAKALSEQAKVKVTPEPLPENKAHIEADGTLKDIGSKKIHEIINAELYSEVVITLGKTSRSKDQTFEKSVTEIKLVPGKEGNVDTYVIADNQPHAGKRLRVYDGDKISSVKRKTTDLPPTPPAA